MSGPKTPKDFEVNQEVIYVPHHADGDTLHEDCEHGVVTSKTESLVFVNFDGTGRGQACDPSHLQ